MPGVSESAGVSSLSLRELEEQLAELRARVVALERQAGLAGQAAVSAFVEVPAAVVPPQAEAAAPPTAAPGVEPAAAPAAPIEPSPTTSLMPHVGVTLLGLAAAYLLRALSEMGILPMPVGVGLGVLYALGWLVLAARTALADDGLAILRSLTSVFILVPLLWEGQVRFQAIAPWAAATVLLVFSTFGLGISWRQSRAAIAWITSIAGLFTLSALLVATHNLAPYTWGLLAVAAVVEVSACFDHWLSERWLTAITADFAVWLMTYIATRPNGLPEGYTALSNNSVLAAQIALLVVYFGGTFARTLVRGRAVDVFEILQCIGVFLISTTGAVRVSAGHPTSVLLVGVFSLTCAVACYVVSFVVLARHSDRDRNFHTYATFGLALAGLGLWLTFSGLPLVAILSAMAVLLVGAGAQARRLTLKWHGLVYLVLASAASGVLASMASRFLGVDAHAMPGWPPPAAWVAAVGAVAASAVVLFAGRRAAGAAWPAADYRALVASLAAVAAWSVADVLAALAAIRCPNHSAALLTGADTCPTLFTLILVAAALGSAWIARLERPELAWTAYLLIGMATVKLMLQELRLGHALAIVVSLLIYGGALVLLPRILPKRRYPARPPVSASRAAAV